MRRKALALAALLATGAFLTACGSSGPSSAGTQSTSSAKHAFAHSSKAAQDALDYFASHLKGTPTGAPVEGLAEPAVKALQSFETTLTNTSWPATSKGDVQALIPALANLEGDLASIGAQTPATLPNFLKTFFRDLSTTSADNNLVVHDLGLKP
jgi:hypothetical protein